MTSIPTTRMTAAEFLALPETNQPIELIAGQVIMSPAPIPTHQRIARQLTLLLSRNLEIVGGEILFSPIDLYLDEDNVVQPDLIYRAPNSRCVEQEKFFAGPPEVVIEVLSPGSRQADKDDKFRVYERHEVCEYWIVDPKMQQVEVWQYREGRFKLLDVYSPGETFESRIVGVIDVQVLFEV